jgi:hypothetical protein
MYCKHIDLDTPQTASVFIVCSHNERFMHLSEIKQLSNLQYGRYVLQKL